MDGILGFLSCLDLAECLLDAKHVQVIHLVSHVKIDSASHPVKFA